MSLHEKGACQNDMRTVSLQLYGFAYWTSTERFVLLNGPVPECLRLVHGKELPVSKGWNSRLPTWEPQVTIARNCRFPELGTPGSQPGNHGLPLQATAGYQRLELMLPNLGTIGYHCKELPFPEVGTDGSQRGNQRLPWQGTAGSQTLKLTVPNLGTRVRRHLQPHTGVHENNYFVVCIVIFLLFASVVFFGPVICPCHFSVIFLSFFCCLFWSCPLSLSFFVIFLSFFYHFPIIFYNF